MYGGSPINLAAFTVGATQEDLTVYSAAIAGIQNGSPDGLALVQDGALIPGQFLSYEGSFAATDGPALGETSTDIGVEELGTTPIGQSLQLTGTGTQYSDFVWQAPAEASFGSFNAGQTIGEGSGVPRVALTAAAVTADEGDTVTLTVEIDYPDDAPDGNDVEVALAFLPGSSTADADDFSGPTPATVTFSGDTDNEQLSFSLSLTADDGAEDSEDAVFGISVVSGTADLGTPRETTVTITDGDIGPPAPSDRTFSADLAGANEVPPVITDASGTVLAQLNGRILTLSGAFTGLESDYNTAVGAHLHNGTAGENGPVIIALDPDVDADLRGGTFEAEANTFTLTEEQTTALQTGMLYVNVHTLDNPGGEIRGQLFPAGAAPTTTADLAGANEVPPVTSGGGGFVFALLDGLELTLEGTFTGLDTRYNPAIGSHIHRGMADANGPVIIPLDPTLDADSLGGTFEPADNTYTLTEGQADSLIAGLLYVNIHTLGNPGGEIRGQLYLQLADARDLGPGETVGVEGTVSRAMGDFAYLQDGSAGLTVRQTEGAFNEDVADGTIQPGTELALRGTLSAFRGLLQIDEGDLASYRVEGDGEAPVAQEVPLEAIVANGEGYESELVRIDDLTTDAEGLFEPATNYDVMDETATGTLRIPSADDSAADGTAIPEGPFTFTGVVGQFDSSPPEDEGYQLLAIQESDIAASIVANEDGTVPTTFAVEGAFPNPFAGQTTLRYDLATDARVSVAVYDVLGRRVLQTEPVVVTAGTGRSLVLDAALPSGTYVYRLTAEMPSATRTASGRMTVVR